MGSRVDGSKFLHGVASEEFVVAAGTRVQLRRVKADGPGDEVTHCVVFMPPDQKASPSAIEQACLRNGWHRIDPRDERGDHP